MGGPVQMRLDGGMDVQGLCSSALLWSGACAVEAQQQCKGRGCRGVESPRVGEFSTPGVRGGGGGGIQPPG